MLIKPIMYRMAGPSPTLEFEVRRNYCWFFLHARLGGNTLIRVNIPVFLTQVDEGEGRSCSAPAQVRVWLT